MYKFYVVMCAHFYLFRILSFITINHPKLHFPAPLCRKASSNLAVRGRGNAEYSIVSNDFFYGGEIGVGQGDHQVIFSGCCQSNQNTKPLRRHRDRGVPPQEESCCDSLSPNNLSEWNDFRVANFSIEISLRIQAMW